MKNLEQKVAVVTGAGSGIGRSIAIALATHGAQLVVADIQEASAAEVRDELIAQGARAIAVSVDVAQRQSVVEMADAALSAFGRVDVLCNNADVSWRPSRTVLEATMEDWNFILGVNLWGVVHGLDVFLPRMRMQPGEKHIVNTASLAGLLPLAGHAPYSASKAAVTSLSESISQELASEGFGVTVLCPGFVHTNVTTNSDKLRPAPERAENRQFSPFENPLLKRLALTAMEPEAVGRMVCTAILEGTLYLNTDVVPADLVQERMQTLFGSQTVGRA